MMSKLHSERVSLILLSNAAKSNKTQITNKEASFMISIGQKIKIRANLKAEGRFCKNEGLF